MSASLVGSEMCIRDRLPAVSSALLLRRCAAAPAALHMRPQPSCLRCGSCLLYTSDAADDM
eukprot:10957173-Alexandrium_andersonii.AAC.1